jgi:hypothetical protein
VTLFFVACVGFYLFATWLFADYAESRGYSFLLFFLVGLIASPLVSGLAALVAPDHSAPLGSAGPDLTQLSQLADLHERGALTDAEFAAQKARVLG